MNRPSKKPLDPVSQTLADRQHTHGSFIENGRIMQLLKDGMKTGVNWDELPPEQKEALEMIQHKVGRILSGNSYEPDHWKDIAGYATLIFNNLSTS